MKNYLQRMSLCLLLVGLLLGLGPADAAAETITSADFSMAYGADQQLVNTWSGTENAATNSPTTQGDFTFSPAPTGSMFSKTGCYFPNRTLSNGNSYGVCAYGLNFNVPIVASYNGPEPEDLDPELPYGLKIEITKISIYGGAYPNGGPTTMRWDETTPGYEQNSPSIDLISSTGYKYASNYKQLVWDPDDFILLLASLNDSATRTFDVIHVNELDYRFFDGIEVEGRVHFMYNIPEPATVILLISGLLCLSMRRKLG